MATVEDDDDTFKEVRADEQGAIWQIFKKYGHGYRFEFIIGGIASIVSRALNLLPAFVLGVAIDAFFVGSRPFRLPLVPQSLIPASEWEQFLLATGIILGAFAFGAGLNYINNWAWNHFAQHLQHAVRTDTYEAMQDLELEFFDNKQTGEVMSVLNNDVNRLEQFLTNSLNSLIRIVVRVGGIALIMLWLNWQLAMVTLVIVPILGYASYKFVEIIHPKYQDVRSSVGKLNSRLENNLGGIEVIKAYNKEEFENERVEDASQDYLDANWDAISTRIKFFPSLQLTTGLGFVLTFLVGGIWVTFPERSPLTVPLTAGTLVTFLLYSRRFMWPMRQLGRIINNYQYAEAASERIIGLMNEPSKIDDNPNGIELDEIEGNVVYDDVSFAYEGSDEKTIKNVSFEAEAGDMVGLVGPTGAGKTTVMKLLLRLYDIDSGSIRIDGVDIQDVKLDNLREKISLVSQEPFLFYGTVRENIAYGDPDIDEETIIDAAKRSGAHQFIQELPDGYDTMVGERGVKLSGGQRQRVSIARAILKDPEILILDEATSHVDNETEVLIQNSLNELIADRTSFAIAHRLSTVRNADKIIVMEEGEVVERGTHEELLEHDGLYANLWGVQVGEVESLPQEFIERTARRRSELETTD